MQGTHLPLTSGEKIEKFVQRLLAIDIRFSKLMLPKLELISSELSVMMQKKLNTEVLS